MVHHQDEPKVAVAKAQDERGSHQDLEVAMETARALEAAMAMAGEVVHFHSWEVAMVPPLCGHHLDCDCYAVLVSVTWRVASGTLGQPSYL